MKNKPEQTIQDELLVIKQLLSCWAVALLNQQEDKAVSIISQLSNAITIDPSLNGVTRVHSHADHASQLPIQLSLRKRIIQGYVQRENNYVFFSPLSTGVLCGAVVWATLSNEGFEVDWFPVFVPLQRKKFASTVIPNGEKIGIPTVVDDGTIPIIGSTEDNPLKTVGAVRYKLREMNLLK